ncbi:MAG TPA: hypothetical protein VF795_00505, partial [Desulfuromonadaceae bacterium]
MEPLSPRTAVIMAVYTGVFCIAVPWLLIAAGTHLDLLFPIHFPEGRVPGAVGWLLFASGAAIVAASMVQLWRRGKGLPVSHLPPRQFVTAGLYR